MNNNWIASFAINSTILLLMLIFTNMSYETNDDFAISSRLTQGYPYIGFVNYFFCKVLIILQKFFPDINCFVVSLIAFSYLALICILWIFFEKTENSTLRILAVTALTLFSFDHYSAIQFTKAAALIMTAGLLLLVDSVIRKNHPIYYIISFLFIYIGAAIRIDSLPGLAGFACAYVLIYFILNRNELISEGYLKPKKILLYIILLFFVAGAYGSDIMSSKINVSTKELEYAKDYSQYRSSIVDFPTYKYYKDNKTVYDKIGISENDLYLISHWYFDYDGAASLDSLKKIDAIERHRDSNSEMLVKAVRRFKNQVISHIKRFSLTGVHIILMICIALFMFLSFKSKYWIYIFMIGGMTLALYIVIYYIQREAYRALYVADIGAVVWLIYCVLTAADDDKNTRTQIMNPTAIILSIVIVTLMIPVYRSCEKKHNQAFGKIMSIEAMEYFRSHDDNYYVWATIEKKFFDDYSKPWKAPRNDDKNIIGTGSWGTMSPYIMNRMSLYGISNPISGIIDNDRAFYVGNKNIERLQEYYNKWYPVKGKKIILKKVDTVSGYSVWKVLSQ